MGTCEKVCLCECSLKLSVASLGKHINLEIYFRSLDTSETKRWRLYRVRGMCNLLLYTSKCFILHLSNVNWPQMLKKLTTVSLFTPLTRHHLFPPPRIKYLPHPCNHHLSTLAFSIIFLALKIIHTPFHGLSYLLGLLFSRASLSLLLF